LLEKNLLFFEAGPDPVDGLLGEEPEFQQCLVVFPFAARSVRCTTPSIDRPASERVALVRQKSGESSKKSDRSRLLSRGAG
jgi:hypothetical protein